MMMKQNNKKWNYFGFILLLILISFLVFIIFANPYIFGEKEFDLNLNETGYSDISLSTKDEITKFIEGRSNLLSEDAFSIKRFGKINESQLKDIVESNENAKTSLVIFKSTKNEKDLYRALFYIQKALIYKKSYPFINCANQAYEIAKKYYPLFFYLSQKDKEEILKIESAKQAIIKHLAFATSYKENNTIILNLIRETEDFEKKFEINELNCEEFKDYINKDYVRQQYWFLFKLLVLIVIFLLGFVLGSLLSKKNIKKFEQKSNWIINEIKKVFSPDYIKDETIKSILKTSSVTTALVAFLGIALTISGFNTWFVVILILLSVLSLLASILTGIIGLNNGQESFKKLCYRLFISGLALFIIFFLYIIFFGRITTFFKGMIEATRTYLSNQTAIK